MKKLYDASFIYEWTDDEIIKKTCERIKQLRRSCCLSQQEFSDETGVSIATIKRIESGKTKDISLRTIIKIERMSGILESVVELVPDLPDSPYLTIRGDKNKYCKKIYKTV